MKDILKFGYVKLEELDKTLVYVKEFKLSKVLENWKYNNINFIVHTLKSSSGFLQVHRSKVGRIDEFLLYIGEKENYFIVDNDVVKIFKDLEKYVYNNNNNMILKEYLENDEYYVVRFIPSENKLSFCSYRFDDSNIDLGCFESGNMFKTEKEVKKFIDYVDKNDLNLVKELKKRVSRELKNVCKK